MCAQAFSSLVSRREANLVEMAIGKGRNLILAEDRMVSLTLGARCLESKSPGGPSEHALAPYTRTHLSLGHVGAQLASSCVTSKSAPFPPKPLNALYCLMPSPSQSGQKSHSQPCFTQILLHRESSCPEVFPQVGTWLQAFPVFAEQF